MASSVGQRHRLEGEIRTFAGKLAESIPASLEYGWPTKFVRELDEPWARFDFVPSRTRQLQVIRQLQGELMDKIERLVSEHSVRERDRMRLRKQLYDKGDEMLRRAMDRHAFFEHAAFITNPGETGVRIELPNRSSYTLMIALDRKGQPTEVRTHFKTQDWNASHPLTPEQARHFRDVFFRVHQLIGQHAPKHPDPRVTAILEIAEKHFRGLGKAKIKTNKSPS